MKTFLLLPLAVATIGASPPPEPIAMTRSSWGRTIAAWRIEPDGRIEYVVADGPLRFDAPQRTITHRTGPDADRHAAIATLLEPARRRSGDALPCTQTITDQQYGTVSFGNRKLGYYDGCREAATRAIVARLFRAEEQVARWTGVIPAAGKKAVP